MKGTVNRTSAMLSGETGQNYYSIEEPGMKGENRFPGSTVDDRAKRTPGTLDVYTAGKCGVLGTSIIP